MANTYLLKNERIYFYTSYNPNFVTDVKEITGRRWDADDKVWVVPVNFTTSNQIKELISKYNISESETAKGELLLLEDIETSVESILPIVRSKIDKLQLNIKPREYQLRGIAYNMLTKRCTNGSAMGTGKTLTSIFTVEAGNLFPCVCVVPSNVKYNWQKQWNRVNPDRTVSVIENDKSDFTSDVLIMTYDSVGKKIIVEEKVKGVIEKKEKIIFKYPKIGEIKFKSLVGDETQFVKSNKALRSKGLAKLARGIEYKFFNTGTAIMNRPSEIINPLTILGQFTPNFGDWMDFVYKYCGAKQTQFGMDISGATNTKELNQKLRNSCYFRVEKRDVLTELPDLEETILEVDIDNQKEYSWAEDNLIGYLKSNFGQIKADNASLAEQLVLINTLSTLATKGKMKELKEWLDTFLESSNEKLVIFGVHVEFLKELAKQYKCDVIIGGIIDKKKQKIIEDFQVDDKRFLFLNIMTGGVGIDGLQNICSTVLIYEFPWRWADIEQAYSRIERDGQKNKIAVYYMIAKDTIDEKIWNEVLMEKRKITDAVIIGKDLKETNNTINNLLKNYL